MHLNYITSYAQVHRQLRAVRAAEARAAAWLDGAAFGSRPGQGHTGRLVACPVCLGRLALGFCPECRRDWER
jgi:hypothetical protein